MILGLIVLAVGLGLGGCARSNKNAKLVRDCVLPDDQKNTLSGRWTSLPVPIAVKANNFNDEEMSKLSVAAETWNRFTKSSLGIESLNHGNGAETNQSQANKSPAICSQSIIRDHEFTGQVVIYKYTTWPYTNHNAIALTTFCPKPMKPYPEIFSAIMELNYQDFFVEGKKLPDLQSIFLHELGHLLGLNHSCEVRKASGVPDCRSSDLPVTYYQASMFPIFNFDSSGIGERRQALGENDQGRANCLYKDLLEQQ